jgi:hypothetical protein
MNVKTPPVYNVNDHFEDSRYSDEDTWQPSKVFVYSQLNTSARRSINVLGLEICVGSYSDAFDKDREKEDDAFSFYEEDGPYFNEEERLSDYEFGEVDRWGDCVFRILSIEDNERSIEEWNLVQCLVGAQVPNTAFEQALVKLVYQALALGGLHYHYGGTNFGYSESNCNNDIRILDSQSLKNFLASVGKTMTAVTHWWNGSDETSNEYEDVSDHEDTDEGNDLDSSDYEIDYEPESDEYDGGRADNSLSVSSDVSDWGMFSYGQPKK